MQPSFRSSTRADFLTYAQLIVSGLGFLGAILGTGLLFLISLAGLLRSTVDLPDATSIFKLLWVGVLSIGITFFSTLYCLERLGVVKFPLPRLPDLRWTGFLLLLWPFILGLGYLASGLDRLAWLVFPPLQVLAVVMPIAWLASLALTLLSRRKPQRILGIANFSLLITAPLVILVEIILFIVLVGFVIVYAIGQPDLFISLQNIGRQAAMSQPDPEMILPLLRSYLQEPAVLFSIFAILSGLVPLIEELLKPLALWALAFRRLTPAEGFVGGAISGGVFAAFESLFSLASLGQEEWVILVIGRAGTGLLHITTTAMLGWAMASAWQNGGYLKLGLTYLLSSTAHGLWNAFSVFSGLGAILGSETGSFQFITAFARAAPFLLVGLAAVLFGLLLGMRQRLRRELSAASIPIDPLHLT